MLPTNYICTSCLERFDFAQREGYYYLGRETEHINTSIPAADLYAIPVRPAWCNVCEAVCLVEDIASVRTFENAYGMVRARKFIEYPLHTEHLDPELAEQELGAYLHWRVARRHPARALCCGGTNYQVLDAAQPLLRHAGCDFGVVEPRFTISGGTYLAPGIHSPANIRVYGGEGDLIGRLTWRSRDSDAWEVVPMKYPQLSPERDEGD